MEYLLPKLQQVLGVYWVEDKIRYCIMQVSPLELKSLTIDQAKITGVPLYFYLTGSYIGVWPVTDSTSGKLTVDYIARR